MRKIPQKLVDKVLRDYAQTKSVFKTSHRCGLGSSTVHRLLKAHGVECDGLQRHRLSIRKLPLSDQLLADYNSGLSISEIARKYSCHRGSVREALHKAAAKMRPRGNWVRQLSAQECAEITAQYTELGSQTAVAALRGISQPRVSRALRSMGVISARFSGDKHPSWKGGRVGAAGGYIAVRIEDSDPFASMRNGVYVLEHRLVMARALGRPLLTSESVHHINGIRTDNRLENLQLRHGKHGAGVVLVCLDCGSRNLGHRPLS